MPVGRVKCPICEEWFNKDEVEHVVFKNRCYHKDCYATIEHDNVAKEKLHEYIKKIFNMKAPGPKILRQIKKYMEEYEYTYEGIHKALAYFYGVKENSIEKANGGIGIVPWVYVEAQLHFKKEQEVKVKSESLAKTELKEEKKIVINAPTQRITPKKTIDITQL